MSRPPVDPAGGQEPLVDPPTNAAEVLRRLQAMIDAAAAALPVTFTTFDADLRFTSVAGGMERAGTSPADFVGRHISDVTQDGATLAALREALAGAQSTTRAVLNGVTYLTLCGPIRDETGEVVGVVSVSADVTAEVNAEAERARSAELALFMASHDALTALATRSALVAHINALSCSDEGPGALLLLDLDDFSFINDGLGHEIGDAVLLEVAVRVMDAFPGWMVARHGGDEFGVLSPAPIDAERVHELADRVHVALATEVQVGPHAVRVSASVGLALGARGSPSRLIGDAHSALSQAKAAGSGQTRIYDAQLRRQSEERLRIQDGLRVALDTGELRLDYQPILTLAGRQILGAEALLRWTHSPRGRIPPAEFIPIAERSGLIGPIGHWAMTMACEDIRSLQREHGLYVAVNVSARQFLGRDFARWVDEVLERTGLPPTALIVEVTESALMDDIPTIRLAFKRLRAQGVRVALDDFGTGYSSLARLQALPVDVIKLDRAFVSNVDVRPEARGMATAILQMSGAIGAAIIAEGIETQAEADTLVDLGYEMAQGFLLARPMPFEELNDLVGSQWRHDPAHPPG